VFNYLIRADAQNVQTATVQRFVLTNSVRQANGVQRFDFTGLAVIGQQVIIRVIGLRGDFGAPEKSVTVTDTTGASLAGVSTDTQCSPILEAPTQPADPSFITTIEDLQNGVIGVELTAIATDQVGRCPENLIQITASTVVVTPPSPEPNLLGF